FVNLLFSLEAFACIPVQIGQNIRIPNAGTSGVPTKEKFMNNKLTITARFGITAAALLSLSLIGSVGAQNPRPYPALKGGAGSAAASGQTPAPKSNKLLPTGPGTKLNSKDKTFMMKAAQGGMLEVEW